MNKYTVTLTGESNRSRNEPHQIRIISVRLAQKEELYKWKKGQFVFFDDTAGLPGQVSYRTLQLVGVWAKSAYDAKKFAEKFETENYPVKTRKGYEL